MYRWLASRFEILASIRGSPSACPASYRYSDRTPTFLMQTLLARSELETVRLLSTCDSESTTDNTKLFRSSTHTRPKPYTQPYFPGPTYAVYRVRNQSVLSTTLQWHSPSATPATSLDRHRATLRGFLKSQPPHPPLLLSFLFAHHSNPPFSRLRRRKCACDEAMLNQKGSLCV